MMNKEQAFDMIERAKVRELTDEEVADIGVWAESTLATLEEDRARDATLSSHPLVEWITQFTKGTRPTPLFAVNFKKVNRMVMPHVIAVFDLKAAATFNK